MALTQLIDGSADHCFAVSLNFSDVSKAGLDFLQRHRHQGIAPVQARASCKVGITVSEAEVNERLSTWVEERALPMQIDRGRRRSLED